MTKKKPYKNPFLLSDQEKMKLVEKMINACVQYTNGKLAFTQLWYYCRGPRINSAIQAVKERELGYLLYQLYMDFMVWKDSDDGLIRKSAAQIAEWANRNSESPMNVS